VPERSVTDDDVGLPRNWEDVDTRAHLLGDDPQQGMEAAGYALVFGIGLGGVGMILPIPAGGVALAVVGAAGAVGHAVTNRGLLPSMAVATGIVAGSAVIGAMFGLAFLGDPGAFLTMGPRIALSLLGPVVGGALAGALGHAVGLGIRWGLVEAAASVAERTE
jgi:hypothetical protein